MEQFEPSPWARPIVWPHSGIFLIALLVAFAVCFAVLLHAGVTILDKFVKRNSVVAMKYGVANIELYGTGQEELKQALSQRGAILLPISLYNGVAHYKCIGTTLVQNGKVIYTGECGRDGSPEVYQAWKSPSPGALANEFVAYAQLVSGKQLTKK